MVETAPKVFISYSHDSYEHADKVLDLANGLAEVGIEVICDQFVPNPAEGWHRWMENKIEESDYVLMVCTEAYDRRIKGQEKPGTGFGVRWEGSIIYALIYESEGPGGKYIPILFETDAHKFVPLPLKSHTRYLIEQASLDDRQFEDLFRHLTKQPAVEAPEPQPLVKLSPRRSYRKSSGVSETENAPLDFAKPVKAKPYKKGKGGRVDFLNRRITETEDLVQKYRAQGHFYGAIDCVQKLISLNPTWKVDYLLWMIDLYLGLRDNEKVSSVVREAYSISPVKVNVQIYYADVLRQEGNDAGAIKHMDNAIKLGLETSVDYQNACRVLYVLGNYEKANEIINEGEKLFPNAARIFRRKANLLHLMGEREEANIAAERALLLDPNDAYNLLQVGSYYGVNAYYDKAISCFEKVAAMDKANALAPYYIACCYGRQNNVKDAIRFLTRAIIRESLFQQRAKLDEDFEPIRESPEFQELVYEVSQEDLKRDAKEAAK